MYVRFCEEFGYKDIWMRDLTAAEKEDRVVKFLGHQRLVRHNQIDALHGKKCAIQHEFKIRGYRDPTLGIRVPMLLRGIRRVDSAKGKRRKWPVLRRHLLKARELVDLGTLGGSTLWVCLLFMFFFLLRSRNVVAYDGRWDYSLDYILCHGDIILLDKDKNHLSLEKVLRTAGGEDRVAGLEIHVKKNKSDQEGKGYFRRQYRSGDKDLCIVTAYLVHCKMVRTMHKVLRREAPVASVSPRYDHHSDSHSEEEEIEKLPCIRRKDITMILKRAIESIGEKQEDFGSHSLRIGGATAMRTAGFSDSFIGWFGGWKSRSYVVYFATTCEELEADIAMRMSKVDAKVYAR